MNRRELFAGLATLPALSLSALPAVAGYEFWNEASTREWMLMGCRGSTGHKAYYLHHFVDGAKLKADASYLRSIVDLKAQLGFDIN